jgi:tetratricopeptide (TPR) repeat protein
MKKNLFTICCLLVTCFSFGQWDAKKYNEFWDKGDSLYKAKEYKNAAIAYSSALVVSADNISLWESWMTARSWCMANYYDSAFYSLNLATPKNVTFSSLGDILTDKLLNPLYNDKRWQRFKDDMFLKAYNNFLLVQKEAGAEFSNPTQNDASLALALGINTDSAFSHLNKEAYLFLRNKRFDKAYKLFKVSIDNFPSNYTLYQNMVDYYMAIGDMGRAYIYFSRAEVVKPSPILGRFRKRH